MRFETERLGSNVVRFPVEMRAKPSMDLLLDIEPDIREADLLAEAFGLEGPDWNIGDQTDRAMAETISMLELPAGRKERRAMLNGLLKPFVDRAVSACARAHQAGARWDEATARLSSARIEKGYWLAPLESSADYWCGERARLQIAAYEAAQAAHGASRAIEFAARGEAWRPHRVEEDMEAVLAAQEASLAH